MPGNALDILILITALVFAIVGYRRGFVLGVLSFAGFLVGALIGLQLAPLVVNRLDDPVMRLIVALVIAVGLAIAGQAGAFFLGAVLREHIRSPSARVADGIGGGFVSVIAVLSVAWIMAAPLASAPTPWLAAEVRRSAVIGTVDNAIPDPVRSFYESFADAITGSDFPEIFDRLAPTKVPPIQAPDPALRNSQVVAQARQSVVKVLGDAPSCNRRSEGTGFIYAPQKVITNAHVVAGAREVRVELLGRRHRATVVVYDPDRDLAVLHVPSLSGPSLEFAGPALAGDDAIVVGFPLDGPYTAVSARIRERNTINGPDIYQEETVRRDVYAIRSTVRPGNSGGPLLSADGAVYGVIFAAAADDPETGFALTAQEAAPVVNAGLDAFNPVDTQRCD